MPASETTGLPNFVDQVQKDLHVLALTSLLQLATSSQQALFKLVVQILPDADKSRFEKSVKSMNSINSNTGAGGSSTSGQTDTVPKIQLKAF